MSKMIKTNLRTAIEKLKEGHNVVSIIDEKRYPLNPYLRRIEYYPKSDYIVTRGHIMNADWFYEE